MNIYVLIAVNPFFTIPHFKYSLKYYFEIFLNIGIKYFTFKFFLILLAFLNRTSEMFVIRLLKPIILLQNSKQSKLGRD